MTKSTGFLKHNQLLVPSDFSSDKTKLREVYSNFSMDPKRGKVTTKNLREEIASQFTDFNVDENGEVNYE
jgi:hypothetical protein